MRILVLLYPWLELLSLIQLGVETNVFTALGWVILMVFLGVGMLRRVGTAAVVRLREAQQSGILQQHLLLDDMAIAVAALLFIIPGLLSDFFAVVVLIGPLRRWLARRLLPVGANSGAASSAAFYVRAEDSEQAERVTLEGDFERVDKPDDRP
jgi:UPF0716 protein FxsA